MICLILNSVLDLKPKGIENFWFPYNSKPN